MNRDEGFSRWFQRAERDLRMAWTASIHEKDYYNTVFSYQQSLEKLMKGLYFYYTGEHGPFTHSLRSVAQRLAPHLPET